MLSSYTDTKNNKPKIELSSSTYHIKKTGRHSEISESRPVFHDVATDIYHRNQDGLTPQLSLCITNPLRSLGSNQVAFGGMMFPLSAMFIICSILTG